MFEVKKLECIACKQEFIPPTFHEEVLFYPYKGSYKVLDYKSHFKDFKPVEILIEMWITYCPNCGFVHRYKRKIGKMKKIYRSNPNDYEINYEEVDYEKPSADYLDYLNYFIEEIKSVINRELETIPIINWVNLFGYDVENGYKKDDFKFLIRLIANLEEFHDIHMGKDNDLTIPEKIKRYKLPIDLENSLIELNNLRNKIVHKGYEMTESEGNGIYENYYDFLKFLIQSKILPLIGNLREESGYEFLKTDDIYREVSILLQKYFYEQFQFNVSIFNNIRKRMRDLFSW